MAGKKISQLTGSLSPSLSGIVPIVLSGTTYSTTLNSLRQVLVDSGSHYFTGSQKISGSLLVGTGSFHTDNPEVLHVQNSNSYNVAHFEGNHGNYIQFNLKNTNSGSNASADIVVTADNGNEGNHFIDLGINSSTYQGGFVGRENDAYLLNVGKDLYIGTIGGESHPSKVHLFAENNWENPQITIHTGSQVTFNTSSFTEDYMYEFSGSVKLQNELSVNGSVTSNGATINEIVNLESVVETIVPYNSPSTEITHSFIDGSIVYITGATSDIIVNVTNVPTTNNKAIGLTVMFEQGSTAYEITSLQINSEDEGSVSINWYGGGQPSGTINSTDIFAFSLIKVNNSWRVLGQKTSF
jgi:hypothetical protein